MEEEGTFNESDLSIHSSEIWSSSNINSESVQLQVDLSKYQHLPGIGLYVKKISQTHGKRSVIPWKLPSTVKIEQHPDSITFRTCQSHNQDEVPCLFLSQIPRATMISLLGSQF
jgi:hypothetical protein